MFELRAVTRLLQDVYRTSNCRRVVALIAPG